MNKVDYIMHLGAGICSELQQYLSLSPQHIFLYEGVPASYKRLADKIKPYTNVSAFNAVITARAQDVDFYVAQPTQFSGTRSPQQFKSLFKNLRITVTSTVSGITLEQLIKHHPELTIEESNNLLVIQLNGQEAELINHTDIALLALFDTIQVQIPHVVCGETWDDEHQQAIDKLIDYGFVVVDNLSLKADALHRHVALQQDPEAVARTQLKQEIIELKSQHSQLNARFQSLADDEANVRSEFEQYQATVREEFGELANQIEALESAKQQLEQTLESEKTQYQEQQAKFGQQVASLNQQVKQLIEQKNQSESAKQQLEQTLVSEKTQYQEQQAKFEQQVASLNLQVQQLTEKNHQTESGKQKVQQDLVVSIQNSEQQKLESDKQISSLKEQLASQTHWHQENKNWAESLQKQLKAEQEEAQELKRSERLTQKMLVKAQVDLDDLRSKYAVKVEQEQQLVNLVQELRDKLTLASKYYFKLQQAHPEVLSDTSLIKQEDER